MEDVGKMLKACVVAHPGGVPQQDIDDEFRKFNGFYIPYLSLGYSSLYEYLSTVKGLVKKRNERKQLVYTVVDPKIKHISEMIERQKGSFIGRKKKCRIITQNKITKNQRNILRRRRQVERPSLSNNDHEVLSDHDNWYSDEFDHPIRIKEHEQNLTKVCDPIVNGKQLIGDDFFLQLAIRNIGSEVWRNGPCTALHAGLCRSGQTIMDCLHSLKRVKTMANRLVIMLGAEDIYKGHSSDKMIRDMTDLLDHLETNFAFSRSAITLCTIPPLANLGIHSHREKMANLNRFNNWIKKQTNFGFSCGWDSWMGTHYNIIDFHTKNSTVSGSTDYKFFQMDARMVSGTSHPYVLWNLRGRRLAMNLLHSGS